MRLLSLAIAIAALAACDQSPAQNDAGPDVIGEVSTFDAPSDAAIDAGDADAEVIPCGIDSIWTDLPQHLSCTGLYTDFMNKVTDPAALTYTPGLVLWSDGATKSRWLYLPPNTTIDDTNLDEWTFPVGTKVWKEFQISGQRIETRLFHKSSLTKWVWTTYRWTSDGTDAVLLDDGALNVVGTYEIPKHDDCDTCHGGRNDKLMGVEAVALSLSAAQGVTLDWLAKNAKLTMTPTKTTATLPEDSTGKAAAALGVLHIDCGVSCHNANSNAHANMTGMFTRLPAAAVLAGTATVATLDAYTTTVNIAPTSAQYSGYAMMGFVRLLPGNSAKSLTYTLADFRGPDQMPSIATHTVDTTGVQHLQDWIDAL